MCSIIPRLTSSSYVTWMCTVACSVVWDNMQVSERWQLENNKQLEEIIHAALLTGPVWFSPFILVFFAKCLRYISISFLSNNVIYFKSLLLIDVAQEFFQVSSFHSCLPTLPNLPPVYWLFQMYGILSYVQLFWGSGWFELHVNKDSRNRTYIYPPLRKIHSPMLIKSPLTLPQYVGKHILGLQA